MPSPRETQQLFAAAIKGEPGAAFLDLLDGDSSRTRQGLAAYQRSMLANRVGALAATYPVVMQIVGSEFFHLIARRYGRACPSLSGDLNDYGAGFAEFLQTDADARSLGYLPDVARMEWGMQSAATAADAAAQDFSNLATTAAEQWGELRFETDPAAVRLDSSWPLAAIWEVNQPDYAGDPRVDFDDGAQSLIQRRGRRVGVESLSGAQAAFADALIAGESLAEALLAAQREEAEFDLAAALELFIRNGVLRCARADDQFPIRRTEVIGSAQGAAV